MVDVKVGGQVRLTVHTLGDIASIGSKTLIPIIVLLVLLGLVLSEGATLAEVPFNSHGKLFFRKLGDPGKF